MRYCLKIADNKNKKARASPWGQGTRLFLCLSPHAEAALGRVRGDGFAGKGFNAVSYTHLAITRTCGSGGGSYIGKQLAKAFDIDLYDRTLLRLASEDSGISEELFARADENLSLIHI